MRAESINIFWDYLHPAWLFGPIFDKELRVSSRRKRNYFLRSVYIVLLCLLILLISLTATIVAARTSSPAAFQISRSAEMGKQITVMIVWFQFIVSQLLAIVMLSSSISDEIRSGTLNVLMTTPINSFQIVLGKLFSKLLQVLLLIAISLPLLAIIRVFGGIPWNYLISSLCITLTSVIFTGSLSLFLSVYCRYAYRVIILIIVIYLLVFGVIPGLFYAKAFYFGLTQRDINFVSTLVNPFWAMAITTENILNIRNFVFNCKIHCLIIFGMSLLFLGISIWKIRFAALGEKVKKKAKSESKRVITDEKGVEVAHYHEFSGNIKRVGNNPIIWKEMYKGFLGESWTNKIIYVVIALALIASAISDYRATVNSFPRIRSFQLSSFGRVVIYFIMMLRLAATSAGSIAHEKEGRTLSILLITPINDKDIIRGKVKAALWKNAPLFLLYLIPTFIIILSLDSSDFFMKLFQMPLSVLNIAATVIFVSCCGVYHGVRSKNSAAAIAATIITFFVIVYIGIGLISFIVSLFMTFLYNPAGYSRYISWYNIFMPVINILIVCSLGVVYLRMAERNLRKSIF